MSPGEILNKITGFLKERVIAEHEKEIKRKLPLGTTEQKLDNSGSSERFSILIIS